MDYHLDFYIFFSLIAIGQGIFLLLFLFFKRYKELSYRFLGFILLALLFQLAHDQLVASRVILKVPVLVGMAHFFSYSIGPFILLYVISLTRKDFRFRTIHLLHFLPFLIYNLIRLPHYVSPAGEKVNFLKFYYQAIETNPAYFMKVRGFTDVLSGFLIFDLHKLLYVAISFYFFFQYKRQLQQQLSNLEKTNVRWMMNVLLGYSAIWLLIPIERFHGFYGIDSSLVSHTGALLLSVHVYLIAYQFFSQPAGSSIPADLKPTPSTPGIASEALSDIVRLSNELILNNKLYLDTDLTLPKLAAALDLREHSLSKAINDQLNVNFFDYVNSFRVEEARQLLGNPEMRKFTVEHIGRQAGFSSKTTFYRAFKKQCGITPSKFQKRHFVIK